MPQPSSNQILPSTQVVALSPVHKLKKREIFLDPNDSHWMGTDRNGNELRMLSKSQLDDLFNAATGEIISSGPLPSNHPDIVMWQVEAEITTPDGAKLKRRGTYSLDLRYTERPNESDGSLVKAIFANKWKTAEGVVNEGKKWYKGMPQPDAPTEEWVQWARDKALAEVKQIDRFRIQRAESGAMLRCIRQLLGIKSTYAVEQIKKPWIVYSATFDMTKALRLGGPYEEMARRAFGGMLGTQLNLSDSFIDKLMLEAGGESKKVEEDLLPLEDEEKESVKQLLIENGWRDERTINSWMENLFGESLMEINGRHKKIIEESLKITADANEVAEDWPEGSLVEFKEHLRMCMVLAYAEGSTIVTLMDQAWYDLLYPEMEEEEMEEEAVEEEGGEVIDGEVVSWGDDVEDGNFAEAVGETNTDNGDSNDEHPEGS